jgi:hypothetical protein
MPEDPPDGLPRYRLLTGADDDSFCRRVSDALALGYHLYGSPVATFDGQRVIVGQALLWPASSAQRPE